MNTPKNLFLKIFRDRTGQTPVDLAVKSEMQSMVSLLLRGRADVVPAPSEGGSEVTPTPKLPDLTEKATPKRKLNTLCIQNMRKYSPNMVKTPKKEIMTPGNLVQRPQWGEETPFATPPETLKRGLSHTPKLAIGTPSCKDTYFTTPPGAPKKEQTFLKIVKITPQKNNGSVLASPTIARPAMSPVNNSRLSNLQDKNTVCGEFNDHFSVLNFLTDLGLEKYWPVFRDEEVDFETFVTFGEDNLREIGIK